MLYPAADSWNRDRKGEDDHDRLAPPAKRAKIDDLSNILGDLASASSIAAHYHSLASDKFSDVAEDVKMVAEGIWDLSAQLSALGRLEDSLTALQYYATLYRDLVRMARDRSHLSNKRQLAKALGVLYSSQWQLGQRDDALAIAHERAVLYRDMAKNMAWYRDELAEALELLCVTHSELGQQADALVIAQERATVTPYFGLGKTEMRFSLVVAAMLSESPCPSLQRYVHEVALSLSRGESATEDSRPIIASDTCAIMPGTNTGDCLTEDLLHDSPPSGSIHVHDAAAHTDSRVPSVCSTTCYHVSTEMLPSVYGHWYILSHLQHHVSEDSVRYAILDVRSYFMACYAPGSNKISFRPVLHASHAPITILLDLMQSCLMDCNTDSMYLSTRPAQRTLLLRMLQDTCSASGMLPSTYLVQGPLSDRRPFACGGESSVYRGTWQSRKVAIRVPHAPNNGWDSKLGNEALKAIRREIVAHWQLRHTNVLDMLGIYYRENDNVPSMVVPLMENGSAYMYLQRYEFVDGVRFSTVIHGAASGLAYLHSLRPPVVHGDLHDANIVIDGAGQAMLCDFGLSRIRHEITRTYTCIRGGGREIFTPPELATQAKPRPNEAGDIYTFAMTLLKLGTGEDPFEGEYKNVRETVCKAQSGCRPRRPATLGGLSDASFESLWSLMEKMWTHDPKARPNASEVVAVTQQLVDATSLSEVPEQESLE